MAEKKGTTTDSGFSLPSAPPGTPGLPENGLFLTFDGFAGLNTKPARAAIEDQEAAWCDNFMPIGPSNLRTMWGLGPALFTAPPGSTIVSYNFVNIGATPYCLIFFGNGSIGAVNTATGAPLGIAPSGTITTFATAPFATQWGNQYVLICSAQTNGYFLWDGTNFYQTGSLGPQVDLTSSGLDYTSQPTITAVGGSGSGAMFTTTLQNGVIEAVTVTAPGAGYSLNDAVILAFTGGGSSGSTAIGNAVVSAGSIASVSIVNHGAGYTTTALVSFLGGGGTAATGSVVVSGGTIASVSIANGGEGYLSAPTVYFTDANNPVAQATAELMPFGISGTWAENFQQRVWLINNNKIYFSAPGSVTDFSAGDGAGAFPSTDSFLRAAYTFLLQSNGFLYIGADSSVNTISGVQTTGNPPTTTFSNINVDPQIGTPYPRTAVVYSRAIVFANSFGVHAIYGGAVQKVSAPLDGIYSTVAPANWPAGYTPSSAVAIIFGIHVYILLLPILDPTTQEQRNALMFWDGARWWTGSQENTLQFIASQEIDSVLTAYGTDGTTIWPMFQNPSLCLTKTIQSKLWDKPTFVMTKTSIRNYLLVDLLVPENSVQPAVDITFQIDTEQGSNTVDTGLIANIYWINNSNQTVQWRSN